MCVCVCEREREIERLSAIDCGYFTYWFHSSIHLANHFYLSIDLSDSHVALTDTNETSKK